MSTTPAPTAAQIEEALAIINDAQRRDAIIMLEFASIVKLRGAGVVLSSALLAAAKRATAYREALEIIAGERQCIDNLMSNQDVARAALVAP